MAARKAKPDTAKPTAKPAATKAAAPKRRKAVALPEAEMVPAKAVDAVVTGAAKPARRPAGRAAKVAALLPSHEAIAAETAIAQPAQRPARKIVEAVAETAPVAAEQVRETIQASETIANTMNEGTQTMTNETIDQVQETQRVAADRFQAAFGDVNERSRDAMQRSARLVEELSDLTQGNVDAIVASSRVAARGVEQLSQEVAEYSRRSFEQASATFRSFSEVRSPADLFRLQSDFARSAFDNAVAESSKVSEAVIKLAGEVAEPITSRYAVAAERVKNVAL